ncbi:MAG: hypothetical protein ACLFUH_10895 [Bacteroidales bacterium]
MIGGNFTTGSESIARSMEEAVNEGFSTGFSHGYGMIQQYVWLLLLSLIFEFLMVKIAEHPNSPDKYAERILPKVRSNVWVFRTGLCIVMIFKLYITHINTAL